MLIREILESEKEQYNNVVNSITQSWQWGEFREKTGKKVVRLGEFDGKKLNRGLTIFMHPVPYLSFNIGYAPRSFLPGKNWLAAISEIGKKHNCIFVKIEPDCQEGEKKLEAADFHLITGKSILPKTTFWVDLTKSEDELLAGMAEKTRYNIRLGLKHGVRVVEGKSDKDLEVFINLLTETEKRQGFYSHYPEYYRLLFTTLGRDYCRLLIAYYNKTPLSAIMLFKFKDTLYYPYGGSSLAIRDKMANYVIHWEAIKLGKKLGCRKYNMWGAYKERAKPDDPWFGIYRFKKGFGGKLVTFADSRDLVLNEQLYKYYLWADKIRWRCLGLKRKLIKFIK